MYAEGRRHSGPPRTMELDGRRAPAGNEGGADDEQARACKAADRGGRAGIDGRQLEARAGVCDDRLGLGGRVALELALVDTDPLAQVRDRCCGLRLRAGGRRVALELALVDTDPLAQVRDRCCGLRLRAGGRRVALELALVDTDPLAQVRDRCCGLRLRAGGRRVALELALVDTDPLAQVRDRCSGFGCAPVVDGSPWNWLWSTPTPWLRYGIVPGSPG